MSAPTVAPVLTSTGCGPDKIVHYWCCDPVRAFCGADIDGESECPEDCPCQPCAVCDDLDGTDYSCSCVAS